MEPRGTPPTLRSCVTFASLGEAIADEDDPAGASRGLQQNNGEGNWAREQRLQATDAVERLSTPLHKGASCFWVTSTNFTPFGSICRCLGYMTGLIPDLLPVKTPPKPVTPNRLHTSRIRAPSHSPQRPSQNLLHYTILKRVGGELIGPCSHPSSIFSMSTLIPYPRVWSLPLLPGLLRGRV